MLNRLLNLLPICLPGPLITMRRRYNNEKYCISHLYDGKNGEYICDAIEDSVRDHNHNGVFDNGEEKVYGETAIPCGKYYVTFAKTSLGIGKKAKNGYIPYVHKVHSFKHIRIHPGVDEKNTEGCIILGYNKEKGKVLESEDCCLRFYDKMKYRPFWLEIFDDYSK